jgi:hypothetical protein
MEAHMANSRTFSSFSVAAVCAGILGYGGMAHATFRTFPAIGCLLSQQNITEFANNTLIGGGVPLISEDTLTHAGGQVWNNNSSTTLLLMCPVLNDSSLSVNSIPAGQTETLTVSGFVNTLAPAGSGVDAAACRTFFAGGGSGGQCGVRLSPSAGGTVYHITPSLTAWTAGTSSDSYYVAVSLSVMVSGSANVLWSYQVTQQ